MRYTCWLIKVERLELSHQNIISAQKLSKMTKEVSEDKLLVPVAAAAEWNYLLAPNSTRVKTNKAISAASGPHLAQLD